MNQVDLHDEQRARLAELWMGAQPSVLSFICSAIPRFHDAQDVLQQVAVEAARGFSRYDPQRPFIAWAIAIAKARVARFYEKRSSDACIFSDSALAALADHHVARDPAVGRMISLLDECMAKLDERARSLLTMRYTDDLDSSTIADRLSTNSGTIRGALRRIRGELLACMQRKMGTESAR